MTEQLITFETAKLAKEKEFDIPCLSFYYIEEFNTNEIKTTRKLHEVHDKKYLAPTQSLLQKWLREVHNIHVEAVYGVADKIYDYIIRTNKGSKHIDIDVKTYEEALEKGLQEALKLIQL